MGDLIDVHYIRHNNWTNQSLLELIAAVSLFCLDTVIVSNHQKLGWKENVVP